MILKALVIIGKCFFEEVVSEKKATNLKIIILSVCV